jgi:hypothetical protein
VKFLAAALVLHVMSRAQLREFTVLFVVGWALTLAVFGSCCCRLRRLLRFPSRDFLGFSDRPLLSHSLVRPLVAHLFWPHSL